MRISQNRQVLSWRSSNLNKETLQVETVYLNPDLLTLDPMLFVIH